MLNQCGQKQENTQTKTIAQESSNCHIVIFSLQIDCFVTTKPTIFYILFAITAAGVVPCGVPKKSPRTSSIVQIIFLFRSFEISEDIQCVQNTFRNILLSNV